MFRHLYRYPAFIALLVVAVTVAVPVSARAGVNNDEVKAFVGSMAESAISSLTSTDIERDERKARFRKLVHDYFAINAIAKWVLGRHWARATSEQREEYLSLFEAMLLERYVDGFKNYSGESLEVDRSEQRGDNDFIVHTLLKKPGATQATKVSWRVGVGEKDGKNVYRIVDIFVDGLSMSLTQQKEFNSLIRNNGNSVESLLKKMREIAKPAG